MSENMELWNKLKRPPKEALKQIKGGRLSGMTDISPQWRYMALTEIFGPCGVGWKYEIIKLWTEPASDSQITAFATVNLHTKDSEGWSEAIPGIGGSMLVVKEKNGLHTSDEAYKMAVTDALSVAMKMIGVAADIYLNNLDGSKYRKTPEKKPADLPLPPSFSKEQQSAIDGWKVGGKGEIKRGRDKADWWQENKADVISSCTEKGAKIVYDAVIK